MTLSTNVLAVVSLIAFLAPTAGSRAQGTAATPRDESLVEVIADWNGLVFTTAIAEDRLLTLKGLRTACLMHLAIHDALNAIDRRFEPFAFREPVEEADARSAVVQAAFAVMASQYPDRRPELEERRASQLAPVPDGAGKTSGVELGEACARSALAKRAGDGWDTEAEYRWHPMGPGVYAEFDEHSGTPEGFVFGAGWAKAKPFVLSAPDQFRAPPPPDVESDAYTAAYEEVKEVGRFQSRTRTPDQTHLALWWKDFVENSHNRLARRLVVERNVDAWSAARLFALLDMSVYDAYISSFDNKFHYNHWRPYTAIRWAAHDGNARTEPDTLWDNTHRHTYAFPSYPSAHGTASAAAMTVLADVFGDEFPFAMRNAVVDIAGPMSAKIGMEPPTRSFGRFSEAAMECALSRVYLGIHFRYDSTEGVRLGEEVGGYVVGNALRPVD